MRRKSIVVSLSPKYDKGTLQAKHSKFKKMQKANLPKGKDAKPRVYRTNVPGQPGCHTYLTTTVAANLFSYAAFFVRKWNEII